MSDSKEKYARADKPPKIKRYLFLGLLALLLAYLCFWPVPIAPKGWDAPLPKGYVGDFAPNNLLADLERIEIGEMDGPEDVVARHENGKLFLYVPSSQNGLIYKVDAATKQSEIFVRTGGVPLGMEFDAGGNLIVVDAFKGLLSISAQGQITVLTDQVDGSPILYADDVDIAPNGLIYFSDASTKFGAEASKTTMEGSRLEIIEHGHTGRLLSYDPATKITRVVKAGLSFANGVAMADDGASLLLIETGEYRLLRVWLKGPKTGETDVLLDNLPGFPDNINRGPDGTYFIGLVSKRADILDKLSNKPFLRKVVWRLPEAVKPSAVSYGFIIQIDSEGKVLKTWQDPSGAYPQTTGALAPGDGWMYISSLSAPYLGRRPFP